MSLVDPCACRLSREAAMTCPREVRGELVWTPDDAEVSVGPIEVIAPDGRQEVLTFGSEWSHFSEQLARDHARIRHLDFKVAEHA